MRLHNRSLLKPIRQKLRTNATPAEKLLWMFLKNSQLDGRKFRRQHAFGSYVLDFYCPSERLCVELDGEHHLQPSAIRKDQRRDAYLSDHSIRVMRFSNFEVYENTGRVLDAIAESWRNHPPPKRRWAGLPSPRK